MSIYIHIHWYLWCQELMFFKNDIFILTLTSLLKSRYSTAFRERIQLLEDPNLTVFWQEQKRPAICELISTRWGPKPSLTWLTTWLTRVYGTCEYSLSRHNQLAIRGTQFVSHPYVLHKGLNNCIKTNVYPVRGCDYQTPVTSCT